MLGQVAKNRAIQIRHGEARIRLRELHIHPLPFVLKSEWLLENNRHDMIDPVIPIDRSVTDRIGELGREAGWQVQ